MKGTDKPHTLATDYTGRTVGELFVREYAGLRVRGKRKHPCWHVTCRRCGLEREVASDVLHTIEAQKKPGCPRCRGHALIARRVDFAALAIRNAAIVAALAQGCPAREVAARFGLTRQMVWSINRKAKGVKNGTGSEDPAAGGVRAGPLPAARQADPAQAE